MDIEKLIVVAQEAKKILTSVSLNSASEGVRTHAGNCVEQLTELLPAESIKPCPFCGSKGLLSAKHDGYFKVNCSNPSCMVSQNVAHRESKYAINAWNQRPSTEQPE